MKKELKPKNGWRKSLIFCLRGKAAEVKSVDFTQTGETEKLLAGLTALERSWYYRAPLSSQFSGEIKPAKSGKKQKASSLVASRTRSRLPAIPVRRSTLIDIIKSKRLPDGLLEETELFPA